MSLKTVVDQSDRREAKLSVFIRFVVYGAQNGIFQIAFSFFGLCFAGKDRARWVMLQADCNALFVRLAGVCWC